LKPSLDRGKIAAVGHVWVRNAHTGIRAMGRSSGTEQVARLRDNPGGSGDDAAPGTAAQFLPLVYDQLKQLARHRMALERRDHTLEATALVHEAYLRLVHGDHGADVPWPDRAHFFRAAAQAMRRILVEHARARGRRKRGGRRRRLPLDVLDLASDAHLPDVLAIDDARDRLEQSSPAVADVVRLRFFAGLSEVETAKTLGVSDRTVRRDWTYARAWLFRELGYDGSAQ
jgi:RNA polymerase sigma factor (TIGR02999 family)